MTASCRFISSSGTPAPVRSVQGIIADAPTDICTPFNRVIPAGLKYTADGSSASATKALPWPRALVPTIWVEKPLEPTAKDSVAEKKLITTASKDFQRIWTIAPV